MVKQILFGGFLIWLSLYCNKLFAKAEPLIFVAESLPPYHYLDDANKPTGALVDIVRAISKSAKFDIRIEIKPFARGFAQMKHHPNVFMFSLLKTPKRQQQFQWVGQIYHTEAFLVGLQGRSELHIMDLNQAKEKVVGTIRGYYSQQFLEDAGFNTDYNLSLSVNYQQMWQMLIKGRIDYILTNSLALDKELASIKVKQQSIEQYLAVEDFPSQLHIATSLQTSKETVEKLKQGLSDIKRKGQYAKIITAWELEKGP